jgi:type I protein arginine methyltransferase
MYSLEQFAAMFSDRVRMDAYSAAIAKYVRPGDAVLDLGCGPGIFALLACKAGARRVYAIDMNSVVDFGRHLAAANGYQEKVQFLCGDSRQIHLPERVNVVISDVRGVLPLYSHSVGTLEDARTRLLAEGGQMLPTRDTLMCAIVEVPEYYREIADAWKSIPQLDLSAGLPLVLNGVYRERLKPEQVLSEVQPWHSLDYTTGAKASALGSVKLTASRTGVGNGLGLWFKTELGDGISYCTEPRTGDTVYGHTFLPWLAPVPLCEGDVCEVDLYANLVGDDYVWRWETRAPATDTRAAIDFRQSSFYGSVFSPSFLKKHAAEFVPVLSEAGLAERWILQAIDGKRSLESIASETARRFPYVFRSAETAFNRVADIAEKFAR